MWRNVPGMLIVLFFLLNFRVLLDNGNWRRDTTLRIECLFDTTKCCRNVQLDSETGVGPGSRYHENLLGNYTATNLQNGRFFYTRNIGNGLCTEKNKTES